MKRRNFMKMLGSAGALPVMPRLAFGSTAVPDALYARAAALAPELDGEVVTSLRHIFRLDTQGAEALFDRLVSNNVVTYADRYEFAATLFDPSRNPTLRNASPEHRQSFSERVKSFLKDDEDAEPNRGESEPEDSDETA